jgi:hypothetical protein
MGRRALAVGEPRQAFMARLVGISRGRPYRQAVAVPQDAPPGRYRVVKRFTSRPSGRRIELSAALRIRR